MAGAILIPARIICKPFAIKSGPTSKPYTSAAAALVLQPTTDGHHSLLLATKPLELDVLADVTRTENRDLTLLELLLDDLPATNHLLLVHRGDSPGVNLDVGKLGQDAALLNLVGKLLGLGRRDEGIHKVGDSLDAGELAVGEEVAGHFLDALGSLLNWKVLLAILSLTM